MLCAILKPQTKPHLKNMLSSIRAIQLEELLKKCRIFVPIDRWLVGCLDKIGEHILVTRDEERSEISF